MQKETYERTADFIRRHGVLLRLLLGLNIAIPTVFYGSFPVLLLWQFFTGGAYLRTTLTADIPFVLLTVFRRAYNRPRPYEALGITPLIAKEKSGQSFPSRHVFSAFIIAMCWLRFEPTVGAVLLVFGLILGIIRVLGGVHYISDVVAGGLFAVVCGLAGLWI